MVRPKPRPCALREALRPGRTYPRMVDLGYPPPRDAPQVDRADVLGLVLHRHHRFPLHPQLGRHAPRRGSVDSACTTAFLLTPETRALWPGLACTCRDRHRLRVRVQA